MTVSARELGRTPGRVLQRLRSTERGAELVTHHGVPVAVLTPIEPAVYEQELLAAYLERLRATPPLGVLPDLDWVLRRCAARTPQ